MLSEDKFKNKYLQHPISFLTEENLDKLETHCRKAVNFERGFEHKVVLELLDRYYQYQKELKDKNNRITKLQKENDELKNHIHYKKCEYCGNEYKSKRSDSKYCKKCAKTQNNKNWYLNLTDE